MSYNPNIAAARRIARAHAREVGIPHQQALEALARIAGSGDWATYLADPLVLPDDASRRLKGMHSGMSRKDPADSFVTRGEAAVRKEPTFEAPRRRSSRIGTIAAMTLVGTALVAAAPAIGGTESSVSMDISEQHRIATSATLGSIMGPRDQTGIRDGARNNYVTVSNRPNGRRAALVTMFDYRPGTPWPGQRYVMPALRAIGIAPVDWNMRWAGERSEMLAYHPVVRIRFDVDCRGGTAYVEATEIADDLVSAPYREQAAENPRRKRVVLSEKDRGILCSADTMERSDMLRSM